MLKRKKIMLIAFITLSSILGLFVILTTYQNQVNKELDLENVLAVYNYNSNENSDLQSIIHETQKNVVQINVDTHYNDRIGSGFLYNTRGDIITNAHVIQDARSITVTMANAETYPAAIVGIGEEQDIAVIRVPQLINQTPMEIEVNDRLPIGAEVLAVGSPLGFQNSVSLGIISGINRSFEINEFLYDNVYQISANIRQGNSGGPLVDTNTGRVVGVNAAGIDDSGIAFSIPIQSIIDDVTNWSTSVTDEDLIFPNYSRSLVREPDLIKEDADYLINYFFESVLMRDYLNAYTLLGSQLQSDMDYSAFRGKFSHGKTLELVQMESDYIDDKEHVLVTADVNKTEIDDNRQLSSIYTFIVAYENDQLKIIDFTIETSTT
ncbi:hypothetical protein J2T56_002180 [Natronobacillus azotifigens]|uniref:Trypsin-like peptidase domain-containing protein n=1 Tax=Natronobacillus azotifigens TaxID=472978 RepID=A0A9J6RF30_9BACI|nr:trypsin-like peptidase domain-containing protein [Natronobacillus azotifigens]MCZ0703947.1 trypsin-like peptidase domain-containing protein [Natronobacillus azotifigens]